MNTSRFSGKQKKLLLTGCGGVAALCALCVGGSVVMNALGLLPTDTPTSTNAAAALKPATQTFAPTASNIPTASNTPTIIPTETIAPTLTPTPTELPTLTPTMIALPVEAQCVPDGADRQTGIVVKVVDGDTIDVQLEDGNVYPVRYIGINTPEMSESFGKEAADKNQELVGGKTVMLIKDVSETDQYDRLLRYVFVGNAFINYELVKQGYAQAVNYPPDVSCKGTFRTAQQEAAGAGLGLWGIAQAQETPTSPAASGGNVILQNIFFDGTKGRTEPDEYAEIANVGSDPVNLSGWNLNAGAKGQDFYFPDFTIQPGQVCRVYTNEVHPESCGFSFHSDQALWRNSGDCGYLYNREGIEVSKKCY